MNCEELAFNVTHQEFGWVMGVLDGRDVPDANIRSRRIYKYQDNNTEGVYSAVRRAQQKTKN